MKKLLLLIPFLLLCGCRGNNAPSTIQKNDTSAVVTTINVLDNEQVIIDKIETYIKENKLDEWNNPEYPFDFVLPYTVKVGENEGLKVYKTEIYCHNNFGYNVLIYLTSIVNDEIQDCVFVKKL